MSVLVTASTGFVGTRLASALREQAELARAGCERRPTRSAPVKVPTPFDDTRRTAGAES